MYAIDEGDIEVKFFYVQSYQERYEDCELRTTKYDLKKSLGL